MAIGPIDYLGQIQRPDLGQSLLQGLKIGATIQELLAARAQREQAALEKQKADEMKKQYSMDLQDTLNNPSQANWGKLIAKYPGQREAFGDAAKLYGQERIDTEFNAGAKISTALENGAPEVARSQLTTIIEAKKNAGEDPGIYQQIMDQLDAGNIKGAQGMTNMALSLADPDKFTKIATEQRESQLQPGEIKKQNAELLQQGADLGLTKAQTKKVLAETAKLNNESQKALLELEGQGKITDPEKRFNAEDKLRDDYFSKAEDYRGTLDAFDRISATYSTYQDKKATEEDKAAADIGMIYAYMKMLDPGSTVMEGEQASARNAAGIPQRIQNIYNRLLGGESLNDSQRKSFFGQAQRLGQKAQKSDEQIRNLITKQADKYGLDTAGIFTARGGEAPATETTETTETEQTTTQTAPATEQTPEAGTAEVDATELNDILSLYPE